MFIEITFTWYNMWNTVINIIDKWQVRYTSFGAGTEEHTQQIWNDSAALHAGHIPLQPHGDSWL